ncbi:MAG: (d)CMP kinase [Candidatus Ancillula sp.]|jgi:cytidylate kinase|nr:(d)CMP kinase [Candidatus Ancillula sp.]
MNKIIAIDGPAGSGKSSTSKAVAVKLGFAHLDTGAMYRAATVYCMNQQVPFEDPISVSCAILQMSAEKAIEISVSPVDFYLVLGGVDVTKKIREPEVTKNIHFVSSNSEARQYIVQIQKELISKYNQEGIVVEGRDATDVLAPDARLRLILTASAEIRAKRRAAQIGHSATDIQEIKKILEKIEYRDKIDSQTNDFTNATNGIIELDNSDMTFDETVDKIIELFDNKVD